MHGPDDSAIPLGPQYIKFPRSDAPARFLLGPDIPIDTGNDVVRATRRFTTGVLRMEIGNASGCPRRPYR